MKFCISLGEWNVENSIDYDSYNGSLTYLIIREDDSNVNDTIGPATSLF